MIRCKEGSILSTEEEYRGIADMWEAEELDRQIAMEYPRKGKVRGKHHMEWISEIDCRGYKLTLPVLEIETESEKTGKKETKTYQRLTNLRVTEKNAGEFASAGRGRWQIENEGFNLQKNIRYDIQHANSEDYNAMKRHYLLTQTADILLQLYEEGIPEFREIKRDIKKYAARPGEVIHMSKKSGVIWLGDVDNFSEKREYCNTDLLYHRHGRGLRSGFRKSFEYVGRKAA